MSDEMFPSLRHPRPTPKDLVTDGRCLFGAFDREFENLDMLGIKNPTRFPDFLKRYKLTLWHATEIHLDECMLLAVVCDMGIFGITINVFYDKVEKKVYSWSTKLKSRDTKIAPSLLHGNEAEGVTPDSHVHYQFWEGKATLDGHHRDDDHTIEYDFEFERVSEPSVVSIPFAPIAERHRPLYSQKDLYRIKGTLTFDGKTYEANETSAGVIDDHRGYYPRRAHYDWLTTLGVHPDDGQWFGFNLTRNQSVDQVRYNENVVWRPDQMTLLPEVHFERDVPTIDFDGHATWRVTDDHGLVDVTFHVADIFRMETHAQPFVDISYFVAFGELEGKITDHLGNTFVLDGMPGMGEDKTLLL